jgi:hypothetical protein
MEFAQTRFKKRDAAQIPVDRAVGQAVALMPASVAKRNSQGGETIPATLRSLSPARLNQGR